MQELAAEPAGRPKRARRAQTAPAELAAEEIGVGIAAEDVAVPVDGEAPKKKRRGKGPDPNAYGEALSVSPPMMRGLRQAQPLERQRAAVRVMSGAPCRLL